ncbi:MAG: amino acid ABC transporter substrate-binding protein [Acidimicrobiales bacterium]
MKHGYRRYLRVLSATSLTGASLLTIVGASGASARSHALSPVKIGISLSLSGNFSADGRALQQGYKLWQRDINRVGGLLGHLVVLDIKSDASSPAQVVSNYQALISQDHVALTFGPFSSPLSLLAAQAVSRYGYALVEGAGGAPRVFRAGLHNVFDVSLPVADGLMPFATWVTSLPAARRPRTVAYVTSNNPVTEPQVTTIEPLLRKAHLKVVYNHVFPTKVTNYTSIAHAVAAAKPQVVVLGSANVPTVSAFMQTFERSGFSPKVFIATGGPDQAASFIKAVGLKRADGMMAPRAWYDGSANPLSRTMVDQYVKLYGGTASQVSSDVAEAFSVGQVVAQAVLATGGFNNQKIITYLHSGVTLQSVQGPVSFNARGENPVATAFTFQWQGSKLVQVNPVGDPNSVKVLYPKPAWRK